MPTDADGDDQDLAEVFDEENLGDPDSDMLTFEEMPDVLDVTQAVGDADDDAALIAEDFVDDDDLVALESESDGADVEDDELATRMPEAFDNDSLGEDDIEELPYESEELIDDRGGADLGLDDEAALEDAQPPEDAPLELTDDIDAAPGAIGRSPSRMESIGELSEDDLKELGYRDDKGLR
jgi:hypothetical protein